MLIRRPDGIPQSQVTDERLYESRRRFLGRTGWALAATAVGPLLPRAALARGPQDEPTPLEDVLSYNNFYEFGTDKAAPKNVITSYSIHYTKLYDGRRVRRLGTRCGRAGCTVRYAR